MTLVPLRRRAALAFLLLFAATSLASGAHALGGAPGCAPDWLPTFGGLPGTSSTVLAQAVFDDGSGPSLFAGSTFHVSPGGDSFLARWGCAPSAFDPLPGCFGNPASLTSSSSALAIGATVSVTLAASQLTTGVGVLFLGTDQTDAAGCGIFVPGIGELLLGLGAPVQLGSGLLSAGALAFALPVPDQPSLVGVEVALHGACVGVFDPGVPIELSNGLIGTIAP